MLQEELGNLATTTQDPVQRTSPRLESGELRSCAVMSLGWEGSGEVARLLGAQERLQRPEKLFRVFTNIIERCDGYVDAFADDGLRAVFGSRGTAESCCVHAVKAGRAILQVSQNLVELLEERNLSFALRIGISGAAVTADAAGLTDATEPTNIATSIQRAARPNTVVVDPSVALALGDAFVLAREREIVVEGKPEALRVAEVVGANLGQLVSRDLREVVARVQFFGRLDELRAVEEFYRESSRSSYPPERWEITLGRVPNRNRFLGLKAPEGYGKSRLVDEFVRRLKIRKTAPTPVHIVGACPSRPADYFAPFVEMILRQLELPGSANPQEKKFALDLCYFELAKRLPDDLRELKQRLESTQIAVAHLLEASDDFTRFDHLDARSQDIEKRLGVRTLLEAFYYQANVQLLPKLRAFWKEKSASLRANVGRPGGALPSLPESVPARPLVIQIDELHWAGESTLGFLQFLFDTISVPQPVIFIGTYGPDFELPRRWSRSIVPEEIVMRPMADYELRMMLNSMLDGFRCPAELEMKLFEKVKGNPSFLEELVCYLLLEGFIEVDEVEGGYRVIRPFSEFKAPNTMDELLRGRIDALDPLMKQAAQNASLLGREFTVRELDRVGSQLKRRLSGRQLVDALEALARAGIMVRAGEGSGVLDHQRKVYGFRHALNQEGAYGNTTTRERVLLHRLTAELLEEMYGESVEQHLATLAHHWEKAHVLAAAARYWIRLSYRHLKQGWLEEARQSLNHARGLIRKIKDDEEERVRLDLEAKVALASVLIALRRHQDAEQLCGEVRALAMAHRLAPQLSDAERMLGVILRERHRYIDAEEHLHAALHLAREQDDAVRISQALNNLGLLYWELQRFQRSLPVFDEALKIARRAGDKRVIAAALCNAGLAHGHSSQFRNGLELLERALAIAEETGDRWGRAGVLSNIAFFWSNRGRYDLAKKYSSQADTIRKEMGVEGRGLIAWWV